MLILQFFLKKSLTNFSTYQSVSAQFTEVVVVMNHNESLVTTMLREGSADWHFLKKLDPPLVSSISESKG